MEKKTINKFGEHYLLGIDKGGIYHYLEKESWDCGWYWGFGYIHTFTNNKFPQGSRDISSHYHFNSFFENGNAYDNIKKTFTELAITDKELWKLCELMKSAYIAREYAEMIYRGGAHYTHNPCAETIKNHQEYERINKEVLPAIFEEIRKLLKGDNRKDRV